MGENEKVSCVPCRLCGLNGQDRYTDEPAGEGTQCRAGQQSAD